MASWNISEKMMDAALETFFMQKDDVEMRRLTKRVIEAAHKDIKEDRIHNHLDDKSPGFLGEKEKQFIAANYISDTHLKDAIATFAQEKGLEPKNPRIKVWEASIKQDGAYSSLKAEVDYKRVWGVGKSNLDKLKATCGIVERAVKIAAVPAAICGVLAAAYFLGEGALKAFEGGHSGHSNTFSQGDQVWLAGAVTGNQQLQNTGLAMDAGEQFSKGNNLGGALDLALINNNTNGYRSSNYRGDSSYSSVSQDSNPSARVKDNTYRGNEHGVSIAKTKIEKNLLGR